MRGLRADDEAPCCQLDVCLSTADNLSRAVASPNLPVVAIKRISCLLPLETTEKRALVKIALLAFGWPLALNHFYEGHAGHGLIVLIGTWIAWGSIIGIVVWVFPYFNALFNALREFEDKPPRIADRPSLDPKRQ